MNKVKSIDMNNNFCLEKNKLQLNIVQENLKSLIKRIDCDLNYPIKGDINKDKIIEEIKEQIEEIISFININ